MGETLAGILRVLGALLLAAGILAALTGAYLALAYAVLLAFRYVPLTGRHKNRALPMRPAARDIRSDRPNR
jgi:hypothetical protein